MKNLKKVLALALAFAMCFTMFASAAVFTDVPAGSQYSEAITFLSDLGVIAGKGDGSYYAPDDTITRAEAAGLIARMMTGDTNVSKYAGASNFIDVPKDHWAESAIAYCAIQGITAGVGNGMYAPERTITDGEFIAMITRALGYDTAEAPLSFPYGNIAVAEQKGILDDVTVVATSDALRGEDAQMVYNAIFADYDRYAKQNNVYMGSDDELKFTIAEQVFNLYRAAVGTADKDGNLKNCKSHQWVIAGLYSNEEGKIVARPIKDDDTELYDNLPYVFDYDGDITDVIGYKVELYGEGQHGQDEFELDPSKEFVWSNEWEIKAIKTVKDQTAYDYAPSMDDDDNNGKVKTEDGNTIVFDGDNNAVLFGKDNKDKKAVEALLNTKDGSTYVLYDWNNDDTIDWVVETVRSYYKVKSISTKKLLLETASGATTDEGLSLAFELEDGALKDNKVVLDDGMINFLSFEFCKNKVEAKLAGEVPEMEEGDIVEIVWDLTVEKKQPYANATITVIEKEYQELTNVDSKRKAYFEDEKREKSVPATLFDDAGTTYDGLRESSATDWDVRYNHNGFILTLKEADGETNGYVFVTGFKEGKNTTGSRNLMVMSGRLDNNEVFEDIEIAKNAKIYVADPATAGTAGKLVKTDIQKDNVFANGGTLEKVIGRVFKYRLNEDDQVEYLEEVAFEDYANDDDKAYVYNEKNDRVSAMKTTGDDAKSIVGNEQGWMEKAKVIFAVKYEENETGYTAGVTGICGTLSNNIIGGTLPSKDFKIENVIAVDVDEIPDIGSDKNTKPRGIKFDYDAKKEEIKAAVLGVDTLRHFAGTKIKTGLITMLKWNKSTDTYTLTAVIPGLGETAFETIDKDDVEVLVGNRDSKLTEVRELVHEGDGAKNAVYSEIEFNSNDEIVGVKVMVNDGATYHGKVAGGKYDTYRGVVTGVRNDKYVTLKEARADGTDGTKIVSIRPADQEKIFEVKDETEFYVIHKDVKVKLTKNKVLNAYTDGFDKIDIDDIKDSSLRDLKSYIVNDNDGEDNYYVVDVLADDGKIVAVFVHDKDVKEHSLTAATKAEVKSAEANQYAAADADPGAKAKWVIKIVGTGTYQGVNEAKIDMNLAGTDVVAVVEHGDPGTKVAANMAAALDKVEGYKAKVNTTTPAATTITVEADAVGADTDLVIQSVKATAAGATIPLVTGLAAAEVTERVNGKAAKAKVSAHTDIEIKVTAANADTVTIGNTDKTMTIAIGGATASAAQTFKAGTTYSVADIADKVKAAAEDAMAKYIEEKPYTADDDKAKVTCTVSADGKTITVTDGNLAVGQKLAITVNNGDLLTTT